MSDAANDDALQEWVRWLRLPARATDPEAERFASVLGELLQRRKDGQSPEEFVVRMAKMVETVPPELRGHFLRCLGEIDRNVMLVRNVLPQERP
jgi:hypothetical protein